jgi:putative FmdB family regulatory protein
MPLYEYTCCECHSNAELLIRGDEKPECPACGSRELEKQLSVPAAHTSSSPDLPMCQPCDARQCGMPQCAAGGCMMQ